MRMNFMLYKCKSLLFIYSRLYYFYFNYFLLFPKTIYKGRRNRLNITIWKAMICMVFIFTNYNRKGMQYVYLLIVMPCTHKIWIIVSFYTKNMIIINDVITFHNIYIIQLPRYLRGLKILDKYSLPYIIMAYFCFSLVCGEFWHWAPILLLEDLLV